MKVLKQLTSVAIAGMVGIFAVGCGDSRVAEVCEEGDSCGGTAFLQDMNGDVGLEVCEIRGNEQADRADDFDCTVEFDDYADCYVENAKCDNDVYAPDADDCDSELEDLTECLDDGSDVDD